MIKKRNKFIRIIALFLTLLIAVFSITACTNSKSNNLKPFQRNNLALNLSKANLKYFPGYEHYDATKFLKDCKTFEKLALSKSKTNRNRAWKIYDELYKDAVYVNDLTYTAEAGTYEDAQDEYFQKELTYIKKTSNEMNDALKSICAKVCQSKAKDEFKEHINNELLYKSYESYKPLTGELKDLMAKEAELENEYIVANDEIYALSDEEYNGKDANAKLGKIYLELVSVRKQIAKLKGYESFAQYAYEDLYQRDYTEEDLNELKEAVKSVGADIDYFAYYGFADYEMEGVKTEDVLSDVGYVISSFSNRAKDAYKFIRENNLITAGCESQRADAQITYNLTSTKSAIIMLKQSENAALYDYTTFAHEMGHFTHMNLIANPNPLFTENGCLDVMECHSNFLQVLFSLQSDMVFTQPDYFKAFAVTSLCYDVESGCILDEWQKRIYDSKKDLTLDEINALYKEICLEYGVEEYEEMEYDWMWVPHNFSEPMYYISYATSEFTALELWDIARNDFNKGVEIWEDVIFESPFEKGYHETMTNIGLSAFDEPGNAKTILDNAINYLKETEKALYE